MRLHPTEFLQQPQQMLVRILSSIVGILLLVSSVSTSVAADRPNIMIILADDLGYGSLNSYGAEETHFPYTPSEKTKGKSETGLYGDWIHELDLSVGRILETIDRMNVSDETLVIFTSDNGGVLMTEGDRPEAEAYRTGLRCNGTLRGRKHSIYEGGFRVPFIARWPGHVQAATVCDETINLVDMYATIAAVIDRPAASNKEFAEDSFNVLPAILGAALKEPIRNSMIVHSPNGNFAIRRGPWKYIEGKASPTLKKISRRDELGAQLYNLQDDPSEQNNLLSEYPDIANHLADLLNKQRHRGRSR